MYWFSMGVALLVALGIMVIGIMYLVNPRGATQGFGLPLPEAGTNIDWWLRLKGVRDAVSGTIVLAAMACGTPKVVGLALLIEALIPTGDMSLVLAAGGSARKALGIHGLTAALMIVAAISLVFGIA